MNLYSSDNSVLINKSQDCYYDLKVNPAIGAPGGGGISQVFVNSTGTLTLLGNGVSIPIEGHVKLSNQSGNALQALGDGLFVSDAASYSDQDARAALSGEGPIIYSAVNGTINIQVANASTLGALSAADWVTFNAKVGTGANVGAGSDLFKTKNGTTLEFRRIASGSGINVQTQGDSVVIASTVGEYDDADARAAISATAPIQYNPATGVISITQASSTTNGYLSSADWSNFNSRVPQTRIINTTGPLTGGGNLSNDLTIGIPRATLAIDGYLHKDDFNFFSQKQNAITWQPVSAGSTKIVLGGSPALSVNSPFSIDVDEAQLNRANFTGITPISGGGTGASDAAQAFINLAPSIVGNGGKVLGTDGTTISWVTGGGGGGGENPLTFSAPLTRVGDTISIPAATASTNGYLTSSNWISFSDKVGGATNLGATGASVFAQKVGTNLEFRKLLAGSNVTLLEQAQGIVISASAAGGGSDPWNALSIVEFGGIPNSTATASQNANVTAWNNMIAAANDTQLVIIPDGDWYFNSQAIASTIIDPMNTNPLNNTRRFNIKVIGNIFFTNPSSCGFILEGNYHKWDSTSASITSTQTGLPATLQGDGLYIKNCDKAWVEFNRINNFKNGLVVGGESVGIVRGAQYNVVKGLQIRGCDTNLLLTTRGTSTIPPPGGSNNGNWCNANIFYINEIGGGTNPTTGGTYGIRIQKDASSNQGDPFNGNFFFGTSLEGVVNGIYWEFAHFNSIIAMRIEGGAVTNEIFMREDSSTGLECRRNRICDSTVYEHWFVAGGKGIGTVINGTLLDTANSQPIGEYVMSSQTTGIFLGLTGDETSGNTAGGHSSIAFGGFIGGGSVFDHRYAAKYKKIWSAGTFNRYIPFSDQSTLNTASTFTSWPAEFNHLYNNYTAGIGSVTLPTAGATHLDRVLFIKNLSTTALNILGLAAGESPTQIPAKGSMQVMCNGSGWYIVSGSASAGGGGDVTSIETTSVDGQLIQMNGTSGKSIRKISSNGYIKLSGGVPSFSATIPLGDLATTGTPTASTFLNGVGAWVTIGGSGTYIFSTGLSESSGTVTNNLVTGIAAASQTVTGSVNSGGDLILRSTSHATKGQILTQDTIVLRANTTSANTAPIKWTAPTVALDKMTVSEVGAWEWDGVDWWATNQLEGRQKLLTARTNAILTQMTWNANTIGVAYGGTGLTALGSALQVLRVNSAGTALEYATVTGLTTLYSGNGTISSARTVTQDFTLRFQGSAELQKYGAPFRVAAEEIPVSGTLGIKLNSNTITAESFNGSAWVDSNMAITGGTVRIQPVSSPVNGTRAILVDDGNIGGLLFNGTSFVESTLTVNSDLTVEGMTKTTGRRQAIRLVNGSATLTGADEVVLINTGAGNATATLPTSISATAGQRFTIMKTSNDANTVTINAGTNVINGTATTYVLTTFLQSVTLITLGTSGNTWWVISESA